MTKESIREAVARGWCAPGQTHKVMDASLAEAIADSVMQTHSKVASIAEAAANAQQASREGSDFERHLSSLINSFSLENASSTPDFILASYMASCLEAYNRAVRARDSWFGIAPKIGKLKCWESAHGS